jgi:hypothetical protein
MKYILTEEKDTQILLVVVGSPTERKGKEL